MAESKETALADLTEFYQGKQEDMELTLQQVTQEVTQEVTVSRSIIGLLTDARSTS